MLRAARASFVRSPHIVPSSGVLASAAVPQRVAPPLSWPEICESDE